MTKTIELARNVFDVTSDNRCRETFSTDSYGIERFAALIRADERSQPSDERIMEVARKHWKLPGRDVIDFVRELLG